MAIIQQITGTLGGSSAPSTLNNNVVSFWTLDEASGNRADSVDSNTLAESSAISGVAGKIGDAASLVAASGNRLTAADSVNLSFVDSFTMACWVKATTLPGAANYPGIITKRSASNFSYELLYNGDSSRFAWEVSTDGTTTAATVSATTFGAPSTATWYFLLVYFDNAGNTIGISVNDGAVDATAFTGVPFDGTAEFKLGSLIDLFFWDGLIDAVGVWSRVLTAGEITSLYNSANGQQYPFS